ncbi:hypothetical protein, partial [Mesorhizobium sp. M2A.F.Ca.ET.039.01.1.1]|uniref:hypothetical protein n=1 Tax=Mesorhizobium sp. M2A.F.Ca.ET.039.01.1.1 TaxID=2496746 RepID=UPI001AEC94DB
NIPTKGQSGGLAVGLFDKQGHPAEAPDHRQTAIPRGNCVNAILQQYDISFASGSVVFQLFLKMRPSRTVP